MHAAENQYKSKQGIQADAPYDKEEQIFQNKHRLASWGSSSLFGFASASYFAALATFGARLIAWSDQIAINKLKINEGQTIRLWEEAKLFPNKNTPWLLAGMVAFGSACMFFSNWLETKKTILEWRMGGSKIGRKFEMAANEAEETVKMHKQKTPPIVADEIPESVKRTDGKSWVEASRSSGLIQHRMHP